MEDGTPLTGPDAPLDGPALARGVARLFADLGHAVLTEFALATGRRADVAGLGRDGVFAIAEVKSCLADFRADRKWHEYRPFCDVFYFAVAEDFPRAVLPEDAGLIIADRFGGTVVRPAAPVALNAARRRALTLRFARTAGFRLEHHVDPRRPALPDDDGA